MGIAFHARNTEERFGGQVWAGAGSPLRKNWARIAEFYMRRAAEGVFEVRLKTLATRELVLSLRADVVIIATGSSPVRMRMGDRIEAFTVHECVAGKADSARRAIVYDREGFNRPLVAADYLSSRGIAVDFVTPLPTVAGLVEGMMREEMIDQLISRGVRFHPRMDLTPSAEVGKMHVRDVETGAQREIHDVDAVIATIGSTPMSSLADELRRDLAGLYVIGDAKTPDTVESATVQGAELARRL